MQAPMGTEADAFPPFPFESQDLPRGYGRPSPR